MKQPEAIEIRPACCCYLCGKEGIIKYSNLSDRMFGVPGLWNFRQCQDENCGLLWLDPMPTEKGMLNTYPKYYTHGLKRPSTFRVKIMDSIKYILGVDSMVKRVAKLRLPNKSAHSVLDVGCGSGALLDYLKQKGWSVAGTEIDAAAIKIAKDQYGLDIKNGELIKLHLPGNAYDLIIMHHVLEHVHDPISFLAECYRLLKPGGDLIIVTPNYDSWASHFFAKEWFCLEPPRHLYLFSPNNLLKCVNKAGFIESHVWTDNLDSLVYMVSSLDIKRTGRHLAGGKRAIRDLATGLIIKMVAGLWFFFNPNSGEELLLKAVKNYD